MIYQFFMKEGSQRRADDGNLLWNFFRLDYLETILCFVSQQTKTLGTATGTESFSRQLLIINFRFYFQN